MTTQRCGPSSAPLSIEAPIADEERFNTDPEGLAERGRVQFFFHSPLSELPIRDVTNKQGAGQKTEPFLEGQAENYCSECYQTNNIVPFLKSREKYLFLQTTCRNADLEQDGERYIVGYLEKQRALDMGDHYAAQGPISLYAFEDGYPGSKLDCATDKPRMYKLDEAETSKVMDHFADKKDIFEDCLAATLDLERRIDRNLGIPPERDTYLSEEDEDHGGC